MNKHYLLNIRKYIYNSLYFSTRYILKDYISILCFHEIATGGNRYTISEAKFKEIINKISLNSSFISIEDILSNKKIKNSSVLITFDDGYKNILNLTNLFKEYKIKPLLFVLSNNNDVNRFELDNDSDLLSPKEIKQLHRNGITIGCHSATHADLTTLSNEELIKEIVNSKKELERKLGFEIKYFAYPKGKYNENIVKFAKKAGYKAAFTVEPGNINSNTNSFKLERTIIDKTHKIEEFPAVYSPSAFIFRKLTKKLNLWERFLA